MMRIHILFAIAALLVAVCAANLTPPARVIPATDRPLPKKPRKRVKAKA